MDFSELYKHTGAVVLSPDGELIAVAMGYRLCVRFVETLRIAHVFTCVDAIQHVEWSKDSKFLLCGMFKRGIAQAFSLDDPAWVCKVDEGVAGLAYCRWSPDGRHVLTSSDFQVRITAWSLLNRSAARIKFPKFDDHRGLSFSNDGRYMALAKRNDCKDLVTIYAHGSWDEVKTFPVPTIDLADLCWSPNDHYILVWDSPLFYKLLVYYPDGRRVADYSAYTGGLGIKTISWAPSSQFIAVGSFDGKARLLNNISWRPLGDLDHSPTLDLLEYPNVFVFREVDNDTGTDVEGAPKTVYTVETESVSIPTVKEEAGREKPRLGVTKASWSPDSRLLMTRCAKMPTALWIWDVTRLSLSTLIIQKSAIRAAEWDPSHPARLAMSTGGETVYLWSEEGCSCVGVPAANISVVDLKWSRDGRSIVLSDKTQFCCCYPAFADSA